MMEKPSWILTIIFALLINSVRSIKLINPLLNTFDNNSDLISPKCLLQLEEYRQNLAFDESSWAFQMLDATSKIQSGILSLNLAELGNFDQCIAIKTNETQFGTIVGKYCLGFIMFSPNSHLNEQLLREISLRKIGDSLGTLGDIELTDHAQGPTWSICLPDGCQASDITKLVNNWLETVLGDVGITIGFTDLLCQTTKEVNPELSVGALITLFILAILIIIMALSTIYDLFCRFKNRGNGFYFVALNTSLNLEDSSLATELQGELEKLIFFAEVQHKILIAFSVYTNGEKIFKMNRKPGLDQLPCLDGIKFLSVVWVIAGHTYSIPASGSLSNTIDLVKFSDSWYSMFLVSGTLSVDTFFVIGGCLMAYGFLKAKQNKIKFNLFLYYLHRYLRLTPAFALVILISATLLIYLGSGPKWPLVEVYFQKNCVNYWWSSLLYVQNYVNVNQMCLGQSWYLDIDMQLYLVSPIIFLILWKYPKIAFGFIILCLCTCIGLSFSAAWTYKLTAIISNIYGNQQDFSDRYYLLTHTRASPWFIGVILGYIIFKIKHNYMFITINKWIIYVLWIICFITLFACILGGFNTLRDKEYDAWGNALHITFVRPSWAVAISWLIFACTFNYGGPINWILSFPIYQVFNRFTYSLYLTHVTLLYMIVFAEKTPQYFSNFNMAFKFWGTFWFSAGLSLFLVFATESPMIVIERIIFGNRRRPNKLQYDCERGINNDSFKP